MPFGRSLPSCTTKRTGVRRPVCCATMLVSDIQSLHPRIGAMMDISNEISRRKALATASAVFTTSLFTGRVKGANDRIAVGYIGLGAMGSGNVGFGMQVPEIEVA